MTDSPYEPPASDPLPMYLADEGPSLTIPAIGLIASGAISAGWSLLSIVLSFFGVGAVMMDGNEAFMDSAAGLVMNIFIYIFSLVVGGFVMYAAFKMYRRENYSLATFGSIVAIIPCISPCCLLGIPFGIWALVLLGDERVKASFR